MTVSAAIGVAILSAVSAMLVRECGGRLAVPVSMVGGIALLLAALPRMAEAVGALSELSELGAGSWLPAILKILAVGYTVELGADVCRELGEASLAARLELFGKLEILTLSLPALLALLRLALSLVREGAA